MVANNTLSELDLSNTVPKFEMGKLGSLEFNWENCQLSDTKDIKS